MKINIKILAIASAITISMLTGCSKVEQAVNDAYDVGQQVGNVIESIQDKVNEGKQPEVEQSEPNQNVDVNSNAVELLNQAQIGEPLDCDYDRDEWTSSSQSYECEAGHDWHDSNIYSGDDDGEYNSIRSYGFYECQWYNADDDSYTDPYNMEVNSNIGDAGPKGYDWDHIVPLAYANAHGGCNWSVEEKRAFADDPYVGICVNASDNRSKGAKGPSEWLPDENQDDYCYTFLYICVQNNLTVSQDDYDVISNLIDGDETLMIMH